MKLGQKRIKLRKAKNLRMKFEKKKGMKTKKKGWGNLIIHMNKEMNFNCFNVVG
jgi:hypothetical protein